MSTDREKQKENSLSRWSRLKRQSVNAPPAATQPSVVTEPPPLPPLETLTSEADFAAFLHPKVEAKLRQAALRKLFSDPRFNVMDGLDVYIDDYGKADPIPPEMLKQLNQYIQMFEQPQDAEQSTELTPTHAADVANLEPSSPTLSLPEEEIATDISAPELKINQPGSP